MAMCRCAGVFLLLIHATLGSELSPQIVGGENANIEAFPFMVSIRVNEHHYCGATILDRQTILTAAHCCFESMIAYEVHVGSNDLRAITVPHEVTEIIVHEEYNETTALNDIALMKIFPPIVYSATKKAVKLPADGQSTPAGTMAVVTGWGLTTDGGSVSQVLQEVSVPIVDFDTCKNIYLDIAPLEHQICAGYIGMGGKGACQGDSGGPLLVAGVQVGIVSWTIICAGPEYPEVYAEVSAYIKWIAEKTGISLINGILDIL